MVVHTITNASFSIFESSNSVLVCLLDKYIIERPSCDNIANIECSLATVVNVMSFFGSKMFTSGFFAIITFNLTKAFCCFSDLINSTFFFLRFVKSVYFGTYHMQKFTNPPKPYQRLKSRASIWICKWIPAVEKRKRKKKKKKKEGN